MVQKSFFSTTTKTFSSKKSPQLIGVSFGLVFEEVRPLLEEVHVGVREEDEEPPVEAGLVSNWRLQRAEQS